MIHGLLLVNKPPGITSHDLVKKIRNILKQQTVGHCGTLDPMAEGLMLILLGKACKFSHYLSLFDKTYSFKIKLGIVTDTLDMDGKILQKKTVHLEKNFIKDHLKIKGCLDLPVPSFSAVKVKGKKLYQYAREGKDVPFVKKSMYFYDLQILNILNDEISLQISCSKGSYIRSLVSFIGERLGTGACLASLKRLAIHPYHLKQSTSLENFEKESDLFIHQSTNNFSDSFFIPFFHCLSHIKGFDLNKRDEKFFSHGHISESILNVLKNEQDLVNQSGTTVSVRMLSFQSKNLIGVMEIRPFQNPRILNVFNF